MDPLIGFALAHAEQPPLDHLDGVGLQVSEQKEQSIFRGCQRAGPIDREPAGGSRFAIEAPCRHMLLERRLEGRDQDLKLLQGQAGEVQELRRAGLHVSEPYSSHGSCCTATNTLDTELGYGLVVPGCRLPTLGHDATVLGPVKHMPLSRGPSALLDRPCARRPADGQVGTAGWSAFGRTSGWIMRPPSAG